MKEPTPTAPVPFMKTTNIVFLVAGTFNLTGLALGHWVDPRWMLLTAFVGFNMLQTAFTGFCPLERILLKLGVPAGCARGPQDCSGKGCQ